jgi:hypothetical protein
MEEHSMIQSQLTTTNFNLKKFLKFNLPFIECKEYLKYLKELFKGQNIHLHHITESFMGKKHNDLLIKEVTPQEHARIHYEAGQDNIEVNFARSLTLLFGFVLHLIRIIKKNGLEKEIYKVNQ